MSGTEVPYKGFGPIAEPASVQTARYFWYCSSVWSRIVTADHDRLRRHRCVDRAMTMALFSFASKAEVLEKAKTYWNPGKTQFWIDSGVSIWSSTGARGTSSTTCRASG